MKFLSPEGGPALWTPAQQAVLARRILEDDKAHEARRLKKMADLSTMLRDGASSAEVLREMLQRTNLQRGREFDVALDTPIGFTKRGAPIYPIAGAGERLFAIQNSAAATTAAPVKQPTGTAIRTMQQIEAPATLDLSIVEWGCSFDGTTATNAPGQVEMFGTTVAATMSTAAVSGDVTLFNNFGGTGTQITFGGTTHTGFATAAVTEGTVANYRLGDLQLINPTASYLKQFPLNREFEIPSSKLLRVRMTFGTTVNTYIYVIWGEN